MSKSSLFILSFNFHYVSLMLKFPDPAKKRGGGKKEKHAEKKGGEKRAERKRGEKKCAEERGNVPKRNEETCRKKARASSGAVIAVDFYIVVCQIAAPRGGVILSGM